MKLPSWRSAFVALLLALATIIACYWPTAVSMVEIWERSGTFTHAFLVVPISLWLVWRLRDPLRAFEPTPTPWLAIPMLMVGLLWLLGELVSVNAVTQFALVSMVVLSVPMLLGMSLARAIAFPLLFLFFCVPFGEFIMPRLMQWTADITVLGVRLSGVPVYQEGLQFIIPSGHWSVVEACSGIRYLIASICVGVLFAYLNYSSLKRRLIFVIAAAVVPLLANWLRAYGIVMLGHVSDNTLATGVDHLVYGWVFFGIVMTGLFMVGMRWQEPETVPHFNHASVATRHSLPMTVLLLIAVLLLPRVGLWLVERGDAATKPRIDAAQLQSMGEWEVAREGFINWQPLFTQPAAEWKQAYQLGDKQVAAYIAYYRQQDRSHKLVSSENMLAHSDSYWAVVEQGAQEVNGQQMNTATLRGGGVGGAGEQRLRIWRWYWVDGQLTASDIKAKLLTLKSRLMGRGDDGAIVVLYTPLGQQDDADSTLAAFALVVNEPLQRVLAQTRGQR